MSLINGCGFIIVNRDFIMELKIVYSNIPLTKEKLEAGVVFVTEDSDLLGSGLRALPSALKKLSLIHI